MKTDDMLEEFRRAYGEIAGSTGEVPSREAFKRVAKGRGMTDAEFEKFASELRWR